MDETIMVRIPRDLHERIRLESVKKHMSLGRFIEAAMDAASGRQFSREQSAVVRSVDGLPAKKLALLRRFLAVLRETPDAPVMLRGFEHMISAWAGMLRRYPGKA